MGVNNTDRFSNLQKYRDADYYTAHPYLQLDTLYKSEIYKIVAVYAVTSRESDGDVFYFNQYITGGIKRALCHLVQKRSEELRIGTVSTDLDA